VSTKVDTTIETQLLAVKFHHQSLIAEAFLSLLQSHV